MTARPWFHTRRIARGLWLIGEPGHVSSWLVEGEERAALIDTGLGMQPIRPVVEAITRLPVTVVNTHYHFDHVGGDHEWDDVAIHRLGGPPLARAVPQPLLDAYARGAQARLEAFPAYRELDRAWFFLMRPEDELRPLPRDVHDGGWRSRPVAAGRLLEEGDAIDLGGRELTVLHTPGHSPDGIALLDAARGWLFAGDVLDRACVYAHFADSDAAALAASVSRLAGLSDSIAAIMVGHSAQALADVSLIAELERALMDVVEGTARLRRSTDVVGNPMLEAVVRDIAITVPDPAAPAASLTEVA